MFYLISSYTETNCDSENGGHLPSLIRDLFSAPFQACLWWCPGSASWCRLTSSRAAWRSSSRSSSSSSTSSIASQRTRPKPKVRMYLCGCGATNNTLQDLWHSMIQLFMIQVHVGIRKLKIERVTSSARLDFVAAGEETLTEEEVTLEAVHCTYVRVRSSSRSLIAANMQTRHFPCQYKTRHSTDRKAGKKGGN